MNLTEIRSLLNDKDILLTRSLGQTFMHDQNQLRKIVGLAKLTGADQVIEVGPGLGPLTELLLDTADRNAERAHYLQQHLQKRQC